MSNQKLTKQKDKSHKNLLILNNPSNVRDYLYWKII